MTFKKSLIDRYDSVLRQYNLPNYKLLYSPLSETEIVDNLKNLNITEEGLLELYSWKNGFDPKKNVNIQCQINLYGAFQTLESIFTTWEMKVRKSIWNESFIPIFTDGGGEYILFNNEDGDRKGKFYLYSASLLFTEPIGYYDSVEAMLKTEIDSYEQGVIQYDASANWLEVDLDKYYLIGAKYNPTSEFWTFKR